MKKIFALVGMIFLAGCNVPGTYMGVGDVASGTRATGLEGQLLSASIIPIDVNLLHTNLIVRDGVKPYVYHIGDQDVLNVLVWNHPELTIPISQGQTTTALDRATNSIGQNNTQGSGMIVDAYGEIFFPYIGKVKVSGLTLDEARIEITNKLRKYIRNPQVTVYITGFNSQRVNVVGEVMNPGLQAITERQLKLLDAISLCGGINAITADAKHIYVIRSAGRKITVFWLNAKSPQAIVLASRFKLMGDDIVYVTPAGIVSWNRVVSQIVPSIQALWETRSILRD
jgi:polysaccharide export outer membrane protein